MENKKGVNGIINLYSVFDKSAAQTAVNATFYACLSKTKLIDTASYAVRNAPHWNLTDKKRKVIGYKGISYTGI